MAIAVGFNQGKAGEIINDIDQSYKDLKNTIIDEWQTVKQTLQSNWVGDDEQSFESAFVDKVNALYDCANGLSFFGQDSIYITAKAWHEFQVENNLGTSVEVSRFTLDKPKARDTGKILVFKEKSISKEEDRGLVSESSSSTIKNAVEAYVMAIKGKTDGLFAAIEVNSAFFGEQTSGIKHFVEELGKAIGEVTTSVKDLYEALDLVANSNYSEATSEVNASFTSATSQVNEQASSVGGRWG